MGSAAMKIEPIAFEVCLDAACNEDLTPFFERWLIDGIEILGAAFLGDMVEGFEPGIDDYTETAPQAGCYGIASIVSEGGSRTERISINAGTLAQLAAFVRADFDAIEVRLYRLDDQFAFTQDYILLAIGPLRDADGWTRASLQTSKQYFPILNSDGRLLGFIKRACDVCDPAFGHLTANVLTMQTDRERRLRVFADESTSFMRDHLRGTSSISIWSKEFARQVAPHALEGVERFFDIFNLAKGGLLISTRDGGFLTESEKGLLEELTAGRLIKAEMFL